MAVLGRVGLAVAMALLAPEMRQSEMPHAAVAVSPTGELEVSAGSSSALLQEPGLAARSRIPYQLFLTSGFHSLGQTPAGVQQNVQRVIKMNPGIKVVWFDDAACTEFLKASYHVLGELFSHTTHGPYKSDICRTAWLHANGGWYMDLDVDLRQEFMDLSAPGNTFISAWTAAGDGVMNAIIGCAPSSGIMADAVAWLESPAGLKGCMEGSKGESVSGSSCGTEAMQMGLHRFFIHCGETPPNRSGPADSKACGDSIRMLTEVDMADRTQRNEASVNDAKIMEKAIEGRHVAHFRGRAEMGHHFRGLDFALVYAGYPSFVAGYSRFDHCGEWGCGQNPNPFHNEALNYIDTTDEASLRAAKAAGDERRAKKRRSESHPGTAAIPASALPGTKAPVPR